MVNYTEKCGDSELRLTRPFAQQLTREPLKIGKNRGLRDAASAQIVQDIAGEFFLDDDAKQNSRMRRRDRYEPILITAVDGESTSLHGEPS